jgi:hypothetical protein
MAIPPDYGTDSISLAQSLLLLSNPLFDVDTTNFTSTSTAVGGTLTFNVPSNVLSIRGQIYTEYTYTTLKENIVINTIVNGSGEFTMSGLIPGKTYFAKSIGYAGASGTGQAGVHNYFTFTVPAYSADLFNKIDTPEDTYDGEEVPAAVLLPGESTSVKISKSLFTIHADNKTSNIYCAAVKNTGIETVLNYYAFGTTLYFRPTLDSYIQSGAFGFFVSGTSSNGYFIKIKTTANAKSNGDEFSIIKVVKNSQKVITDSQSVTNVKNNVGSITATVPYKVDVRVKVTSTKVFISAYINGFKISATDTHVSATNTILPKTSNISLAVNMGTVNFDYVYAIPIDELAYKNSELENIYSNQFAKTSFNLAYGDMFISGLSPIDSNTAKKYVEEFGSVAREIRVFSAKYANLEPKFPKYMYNNLNTSVSVLGSDLTSFAATAYVLNSSGVTSEISSSDGSKLSVLGNSLTKSEDLVYFDEETNKYEIKEQMTMDSTWIQNPGDAKNLSDWIKTQWSKRQRIIDMSVLANPTVAIGDIVTIDYPYQDLIITDKFVITNVRQSWSEGLETTITARSIYS